MLHICMILLVLQLSTAYDNVALNKPAWQLNQFNPVDDIFDASNAVDGRKSNLSYWGGQCAISANYQRTATWRVDLEDILSIHHITIYYRTENAVWGPSNVFTPRFLGFMLYVSNTTDKTQGKLCFHDTKYTTATIPDVINVTCPVHGRYVIYHNQRLQGVTYPSGYSTYAFNELCEIEVYGCSVSGYYGPDCSVPCPDTNCRYCHIDTGTCQGCKPGYQGHHCELPCSPQYYGELCKETCGNCNDGVTCNNVDGTCSNGCDVGVYGVYCTKPCPVGFHGKNCSLMCTNCATCDRFTGRCTSTCYPGWKAPNCTNECDGGKYGDGCSQDCGACLDYTQCHHVNGTCLPGCAAGYKGDLCKTKCSLGYFGKNCGQICSYNCNNDPKICNRTTGECKNGCRQGCEGVRCDRECSMKTYGENCTQTCGNCKDLKICHHVTGTCFGGCDKGFKGILCQEVCNFGYFGANCTEECSVFCQKSRDCHHVTGFCRAGCKNGWRGSDCLEVHSQLQEKNVEENYETRFYGVLGALCVTLALIGVYILYKITTRNRMGLEKGAKYRSSNTAVSSEETTSQANDVEKISSAYQELGEFSPTSTYETIH